MKKALLLVAFALFVFAGCKTNAGNSETQAIDPEVQTEINVLDSLSTEIDSLKADIDKAAGEVDELIDKL